MLNPFGVSVELIELLRCGLAPVPFCQVSELETEVSGAEKTQGLLHCFVSWILFAVCPRFLGLQPSIRGLYYVTTCFFAFSHRSAARAFPSSGQNMVEHAGQ